jgi:hypothetical protein
LLRLHRRELLPGQVVLQVAPHPLKRVQLRTVGGQPDIADILGPPHPLGGVCPAVIQQEAVQTVGKGLGTGIHKQLTGIRMQRRPFETEPLTRGRGHRAIDIEPCKDVLDRSPGLDPGRCEAAAAHGQQAKTTFVLAAHAHRAGMRRRNDALELLLTGRLKFPKGVRVFWCDWAAAP